MRIREEIEKELNLGWKTGRFNPECQVLELLLDIRELLQNLSTSPSATLETPKETNSGSKKDCYTICPDNYLNKCTNYFRLEKGCEKRKSSPS